MSRNVWKLAMAIVCACWAAPAFADDAADARAVIDKAIKATGGADKLEKHTGVTFKLKGTFYGMGAGIPYTGDFAVQLPDKQKVTIEGEVAGQKFTFLMIVNKDKGWRQIMGGNVDELSKDQLEEQQTDLYASLVATLVPLIKDKEYKLSTIGEEKVNGKPAIGICVQRKGRSEVAMYFDKETNLLVKQEYQTKDESGQEKRQENIISDYKDVAGIKHPMKMVIKRDGKRYVEGEVSEIRPGKIDDSVFAEPK